MTAQNSECRSRMKLLIERGHLIQYRRLSRGGLLSRRRSFEAAGLHHDNPIPMGAVIGNLMMSSGIFGIEPHTRKAPDDIEGQCRLMFENVRKVMAAAGGTPDDIIKMVVWAKDKAFKNALNQEWLDMFPDERSRPARHTMMYNGFSGNILIQCEIVAVLGGNQPKQ